jgi:hypothetical protein
LRSDTHERVFVMIGRAAANGRIRLTLLFHRFDIRRSHAGGAQLYAELKRTAKALAATGLDVRPRRKYSTLTEDRVRISSSET